MKFIIAMLAVLLGLLQYQLWFAGGGLMAVFHLQRDIQKEQVASQKLYAQNNILLADIDDLRHGSEAIEAHARYDLGMVKRGEVFYQIVQP